MHPVSRFENLLDEEISTVHCQEIPICFLYVHIHIIYVDVECQNKLKSYETDVKVYFYNLIFFSILKVKNFFEIMK